MKNILVTGAAGFIGYHLCKALKKQGHTPIGIDNFNDYYDVSLKKQRSSNLDILLYNADILDKKRLKKIIETHDITHVIHLAAQAGVRYSFSNPDAYIDSNLIGFINILEVLKSKPSIKFIFASSSSIYGLNTKTPFCESDITDTPANLYGATKKSNELIAHSYHHLYKIPMIGLRFFTVYGPSGRPDMAYYLFTKNILENRPINIFNHGNMKRDFTYIDDIIDGVISTLNYETGFEIFNLGNNKPIALLNMVEMLEEILNKKAIKNMLPPSPGEVLVTYADIDKSKKLLNFCPKTSIEQGLKNFAIWYHEYHAKSICSKAADQKR